MHTMLSHLIDPIDSLCGENSVLLLNPRVNWVRIPIYATLIEVPYWQAAENPVNPDCVQQRVRWAFSFVASKA